MSAVHDVAVVLGYVWESFILAVLLIAAGMLIGSVYMAVEQRIVARWAHWRRFSQRYDAKHNPQRIDVSNVRTIYPRTGEPLTVATPWGDAS